MSESNNFRRRMYSEYLHKNVLYFVSVQYFTFEVDPANKFIGAEKCAKYSKFMTELWR